MGYDDQAQHQNGNRRKTLALIAQLNTKPYDFKISSLNLHAGGNNVKKAITIIMICMLMSVISCANMSSSEKGALTGAGIGAAGGAAITAIAGGNAAVGAGAGHQNT